MPDLPSSDDALVARMRAGDERAFEIIFRAHFAAVASYAYRFVRSDDVAQDIAQQVLFHLWDRRAMLDVRVLTPYLRTLARRRAIDVLRHDGVAAAIEVAAGDAWETPPGMGRADDAPDDAFERAELGARLERALDRLPPRIRMVALLRWQDGLGRPEIADELGVSVRTVNAQLVEAAKRLRAILPAPE